MKKTADFDQKPTLIFIHGMRGNHHGLVDLARYMRNEYNVLVPDIPGSGDRAELKNKTNDGYADWLHQYIAAQKFTQKPIIIGHSMGSILTSNFIRKYPNDIDQRVIYLSPILRDRRLKNAVFACIVLRNSVYQLFHHFWPTPSSAVNYCSSFRQNQTKIH